MALFSFGKKDKKPSEVSAPVAKTQPTPPKIQTPPGSGSFPAVKPPQPTGLMPATVMPAGTATTQPMSMPRTGGVGLKPARPGVGQSTRSTQRIVLPTPPGARPNNTKSLPTGAPGARINLPIGMILRCLPPEVLADELSKFEANGKAATEIGLPMHMILGQLPSGKVEMALQDLIPHFPAGYLQPTESITSYLPNLINLPLMDVVMRIPPDLLALRPDQKDVDASVINMADPFTEEILREQAESARRQSQTNIIDESQAPQEEFVPRDQVGTAKSVAPPRRPTVEPLIPSPSRTASGPTAIAAPPMPSVAKLPVPPPMSSLRGSPSVPPPSVPAPSSRNISSSGQVPPPGRSPSGEIVLPTRSTTVMPARSQGSSALKSDTLPMPPSDAPVPPVPRHTGRIPAPPPPRHTTSLPVPRRTGSLPQLGQVPVPVAASQVPASAEKTAVAVAAGAPDAAADDLQRLAALAMAQLGDSSESSELPTVVAPTPEQEPEPVPTTEPEAPAPAMAAAPAPFSVPAPVSTPIPISEPAFVSRPLPFVSPEPPVVPAAVQETSPLPPTPSPAAPPPVVPEAHAPASSASVAFNLNTCTAEDLVQNIPGCFPELAESIIRYRTKIGSFKRVEELLDVPGITKDTYTNLTGEAPPNTQLPIQLSLNELLGFPEEQHISLKDVTERIACWPDVTGCVLSQSSGLSLVGTVPRGVDKAAIVAFAPRMFESINKSFSEVSGGETDALVIPSSGTSFHLFRNQDLYLIIMSRLPQMPERHVKVARYALAALGNRKD